MSGRARPERWADIHGERPAAREVPNAAGRRPRAGDVLRLTRAASVQFVEPLLFRMIRIHDWPTYEGWMWIDGYELNAAWDAVARRSLFVKLDGLRWESTAPALLPVPERNAGPRRRGGRASQPPNRGPA